MSSFKNDHMVIEYLKWSTSHREYGPTPEQYSIITKLTFRFECSLVIDTLFKRLNEPGKYWRHVYKALLILHYIAVNGSPEALQKILSRQLEIKTLTQFQKVKESGRDVGINIRVRARVLSELLSPEEASTLESLRESDAKIRCSIFRDMKSNDSVLSVTEDERTMKMKTRELKGVVVTKREMDGSVMEVDVRDAKDMKQGDSNCKKGSQKECKKDAVKETGKYFEDSEEEENQNEKCSDENEKQKENVNENESYSKYSKETQKTQIPSLSVNFSNASNSSNQIQKQNSAFSSMNSKPSPRHSRKSSPKRTNDVQNVLEDSEDIYNQMNGFVYEESEDIESDQSNRSTPMRENPKRDQSKTPRGSLQPPKRKMPSTVKQNATYTPRGNTNRALVSPVNQRCQSQNSYHQNSQLQLFDFDGDVFQNSFSNSERNSRNASKRNSAISTPVNQTQHNGKQNQMNQPQQINQNNQINQINQTQPKKTNSQILQQSYDSMNELNSIQKTQNNQTIQNQNDVFALLANSSNQNQNINSANTAQKQNQIPLQLQSDYSVLMNCYQQPKQNYQVKQNQMNFSMNSSSIYSTVPQTNQINQINQMNTMPRQQNLANQNIVNIDSLLDKPTQQNNTQKQKQNQQNSTDFFDQFNYQLQVNQTKQNNQNNLNNFNTFDFNAVTQNSQNIQNSQKQNQRNQNVFVFNEHMDERKNWKNGIDMNDLTLDSIQQSQRKDEEKKVKVQTQKKTLGDLI